MKGYTFPEHHDLEILKILNQDYHDDYLPCPTKKVLVILPIVLAMDSTIQL